MSRLHESRIENTSGISLHELSGIIKPLKKCNFERLNVPIPGDAPKDFIRMYEYEPGVRRSSKRSWPKYIAKVGHKWYPMESITEYLMNRMGEETGIEMASSQLRIASRQLRFLSRYFLRKDEILVHGAEIFAGYLQDEEFAEEIEKQGLARTLYTFQFAESAICVRFPDQASELLEGFVKMLVFDAIIGNNDRHFYNWGVVTHTLKRNKIPTFAPVFDTARGLFWNYSEEKIVEVYRDPKQMKSKLLTYADKSSPKTGWDKMQTINHFGLVEKIYCEDGRYSEVIKELLSADNLARMICLIDTEFVDLLSNRRADLIKQYLGLRMEKLNEKLKL